MLGVGGERAESRAEGRLKHSRLLDDHGLEELLFKHT